MILYFLKKHTLQNMISRNGNANSKKKKIASGKISSYQIRDRFLWDKKEWTYQKHIWQLRKNPFGRDKDWRGGFCFNYKEITEVMRLQILTDFCSNLEREEDVKNRNIIHSILLRHYPLFAGLIIISLSVMSEWIFGWYLLNVDRRIKQFAIAFWYLNEYYLSIKFTIYK